MITARNLIKHRTRVKCQKCGDFYLISEFERDTDKRICDSCKGETMVTTIPGLLINQDLKVLIPPLQPEELKNLEQSILEEGVRDALVVWKEKGVIVDGHNRYDICTRHNLPYHVVEKSFIDIEAVKIWIKKNQIGRRNLAPYLRAEYLLEVREWEYKRKQAKESSMLNLKQFNTEIVNSQVRVEKPNITQELAKTLNVGEQTASRIIQIKEKAPEPMKEKLRTGDMSINDAYTQIKRQEKEAKREAVREVNRELVQAVTPVAEIIKKDTRYQTIVLDPPWDWGDEGDADQLGRARPTYNTMTIEQISALPLQNLSSADAHIYLWITNRSLPKGFALLERWGFRYITMITWVKPSFGMGNYFRGSTEQILFGVKGSLPLLRKDVGTHFIAPRQEQHSEKPDSFYQLVESCSPGPWLEMFSRKKRNGWIAWGAEV